MSEFIANIKARLNTSEIPKDIKTIEGQPVKLNNVTIDQFAITSMAKQIQDGLNNVKITLPNLSSQLQQQGTNGGKQFAQAFAGQLNTINIDNSGLRGIQSALRNLGYDKDSRLAITQKLKDLQLITGQIQIINRQNGTLDLKIKGVDELGRTVNVTKTNFTGLQDEIGTTISTVQKFGASMSQIKDMGKIEFGMETHSFETKLNNIIQDSQKLTTTSQETKDNIAKLQSAFATMTDDSKGIGERVEAYQRFNQLLPTISEQLRGVANAERETATAAETITKSSTLISEIQAWINNNTIAAERFGTEIIKITSQLQGNSDPTLFSNLKREFENIKAQAKELELDTVSLKRVMSDLDGGTTGVSKITKSISDADTKFQALQTTVSSFKFAKTDSGIESQIASITNGLARVKQLETELRSGTLTPAEMVSKYTQLQSALSSVNNSISTLKPQIDGLSSSEREQAKAVEEAAKAQQTLAKSETLSNKIQAWMDTNTKAAERYGEKLREIQTTLKNNQDSATLKNASIEFQRIQSEAKAAGLIVNGFSSSLKSTALQILGLSSAVAIFHRAWRVVKEMVQNVKDVDKAMTELYRVTNLSASQYEALYDKMTDSAKKYGSTLSDLINSTASWVRLGFNADMAAQLSEISAMYQHVTDLDEGTAVKNLVTAYKGFQESLLSQTGGNEVEAFKTISDVYDRLGKILPMTNYIG